MKYDVVLSNDVIHDLPHPLPVLQKVHATLKPNGVFLVLDIPGRTALADNPYTDMNAMW